LYWFLGGQPKVQCCENVLICVTNFVIFFIPTLSILLFHRSFDDNIMTNEDDSLQIVNISLLSLNQDDVINQCKFTTDHFIPPSSELEYSVLIICLMMNRTITNDMSKMPPQTATIITHSK